MKKVIVTTTINPPTEAIEAFDALPDWTLIVVGDRKTPEDYKLARGHYSTPAEQESYDKALSDCIGWNCIQRRNFGFLLARQFGADIVATIDDDNIPLPGWGEDLLIGKETEVTQWDTRLPAFDPVGTVGPSYLWHRGYPLQLLASRQEQQMSRKVTVKPDVQADFWNGDPDVDAVCRMVFAPNCTFTDNEFPICSNKIGPFNSQNTFLRARVLKDYFMFPGVGRMDDIWPSFYVQALGYKVVWNKASVVQRRNPHDLMQDMLGREPGTGSGELPGYQHNLEIVTRLATDPEAVWEYVPGRCVRAFQLYRKHFANDQAERLPDKKL